MKNFENLTVDDQESVNGGLTWAWEIPGIIGGLVIFLDGVYHAGHTLGEIIYDKING